MPDDKPMLNLSKELGLPKFGNLGSEAGADVKFTGKLEVAKESGEGLVTVTANIPATYHIYSTTTKGGLPTRFKLIGADAELRSNLSRIGMLRPNTPKRSCWTSRNTKERLVGPPGSSCRRALIPNS